MSLAEVLAAQVRMSVNRAFVRSDPDAIGDAVDEIMAAVQEWQHAQRPPVYVGKCEFHTSRTWWHAEGVRCDCPCHDPRPRPRPSIYPTSQETAA